LSVPASATDTSASICRIPVGVPAGSATGLPSSPVTVTIAASAGVAMAAAAIAAARAVMALVLVLMRILPRDPSFPCRAR
jgi:hypothetical protein